MSATLEVEESATVTLTSSLLTNNADGDSVALGEDKNDMSTGNRDTDRNVPVVYVRVVFLKFGEIDTLKETFSADLLIQARWRDPTLDGYERAKLQAAQPVNMDELWNPKLIIDNTIGDPKETTSSAVFYDVNTWQAYVIERRRVKGTFLENLELFQFPFDTQDLTVKLISELPDSEVILEEDPTHVSTINRESFVDEQEWRLYNEVQIFCGSVTKVTVEYDIQSHSFLSCRTHASRRAGFYIYSVFLIMCLICTMAFSTFSVDLAKRENRLQLAFILLLTTVTFKFAVNSSLPRISYLTTLDVYILSSMIILILVCVWHAVVFRIQLKYGAQTAQKADWYVLAGLGASYLIVHTVIAVWVSVRAVRRHRRYRELEDQHKMKLKGQKASASTSVPPLQDVRRAVQSTLQ